MHASPAESREVAVPRLLEEHGSRLYRLGLRLCGSPEDAEDVLQETFLQAYRKWDQYEGRADVRSWLYTIATRACRRLHRRRAGEPDRIGSLDELLPFGAPELGVAPEGDALTGRLRQELREQLEEAIADLPFAFRMPLVLKDVAGLALEEVGSILGLKAATVKTRVHRARLKLRQELERALPRRAIPPPIYSRQVCLDLLHAKQEALDRGVPFPVANEVVCDRCLAVFQTLDLESDLFRDMVDRELPDRLREAILERMKEA